MQGTCLYLQGVPGHHCKSGTNEDTCFDLWYQKGTPFWRTCQFADRFKLLIKLLHCVVSNLHGCHNLYCMHQNLPQIFAETISPTVFWIFDIFSPRSCRRRTLGLFGKQSPKHYFGFSTCWSKLYGLWLRLRLTILDALHRFREVPHVAPLLI